MNSIRNETKPPMYYDGDRAEMLERVPLTARKVLEVGCGRGVFAASLKARQNVEVWGIEICAEVAEDARSRLDKVIVADIEKDPVDLAATCFDCIVFNDVLEHLYDPWGVLMRLRAHLSNNGCLVASIPNIRHFSIIQPLIYYKDWNYVDSGILDKTHLRFFTEKTVQDLFVKSGYEIVKCEGIRPIEFPWKFRLFNWLLGRRFDDMKFQQFACIVKLHNRVDGGDSKI